MILSFVYVLFLEGGFYQELVPLKQDLPGKYWVFKAYSALSWSISIDWVEYPFEVLDSHKNL